LSPAVSVFLIIRFLRNGAAAIQLTFFGLR
jgi:hypothetical protein